MGKYSVDVQFTKSGAKWYVKDGKTVVYRADSEQAARDWADKHNADQAQPTATHPDSAGHTGWSKYSKARRGELDGASAWMAGSFGWVSPTAGTNNCHYCGLDRRTCDCH